MMPSTDRDTIARAAADAGLEFHVFLSGLTDWYKQVDAVVCMGGYNTRRGSLRGRSHRMYSSDPTATRTTNSGHRSRQA
jgi:hypothetical protein